MGTDCQLKEKSRFSGTLMSVLLIFLIFCDVLLCVFAFYVVMSVTISHKTMFGSSLPPVVCRVTHVLFTLFVFVWEQWCPKHIVLSFCFVCLRLVSCIPYDVTFSGLSIADCPCGILYRLHNHIFRLFCFQLLLTRNVTKEEFWILNCLPISQFYFEINT